MGLGKKWSEWKLTVPFPCHLAIHHRNRPCSPTYPCWLSCPTERVPLTPLNLSYPCTNGSHFITVSTSIFPLATYSSTRHPPCEKVALFVPFKYLPLTLNLSSLVLDSPTMGKDCGHSPYLCPTLFYIFCRQCISMLYSSINLWNPNSCLQAFCPFSNQVSGNSMNWKSPC